MKKIFFIYMCVCSFFFVKAQEKMTHSVADSISKIQKDSVKDSVEEYILSEIFIEIDSQEERYRKDMHILRNRILRVYPYAKITADNLVVINENLENLKTKREKRLYIKRSQKYLESEFKEKLKKLSRNDGRILLKLIHRQTGQTTFSLIKEFKSGWKAFWSNNTARAFSLNLKSEYHPDDVLEDFYIETQLNYLFLNYRLEYAPANPPINFNNLRESWKNKIKEDEIFPIELRE